METLQELVEQRRGYKYLREDRTSPYQNHKYDLRKKIYKTWLNKDLSLLCAEGWNLATLGWILQDTNILDKIIVEFSIPPEATIIVPLSSNGKFRTDIICCKKIHKPENLFPKLKNIKKNLKKYKPINPVVAETLPSKKKILNILKKIKAQVGVQVWAQVGDQVWAQVRDQVGAQVGDLVGAQVGDQVSIASHFAVKEFLNLDYDHPAFGLIRLGIIVVKIKNKYWVFGKNGKYLGII